MTDLPPRFIEDRRLRDAARAVLDEDIARLRASLAEQGVASRVSATVGQTITGRVRAGASDVLEQARQRAGDHPGVLAVLIGALLLFLLRGPLAGLIAGFGDEDEDEDNAQGEAEAAPAPAETMQENAGSGPEPARAAPPTA